MARGVAGGVRRRVQFECQTAVVAKPRVLAAPGAPELCDDESLRKREGAGKAGSSPPPRSACERKARGRTTGLAETARPSLRDGLSDLYVISPGTGLLPPSPARSSHRKLGISTGMPGPYDFIVRELSFVRVRSTLQHSRPTAPRLHVRDDRETPLCMRRDARKDAGDLPDGASGIFGPASQTAATGLKDKHKLVFQRSSRARIMSDHRWREVTSIKRCAPIGRMG
jgi:hypothetical protein